MAKHTGFEKLVADARKNITEISPHDAAAKLKSGEAVMIDVRDKDEWEEGHIPGATHLSRGTVELDIEEKVPDPNATIICHCGPEGFRGFRARRREPAENGLQKRPVHGRRLQSLESRRAPDDEVGRTSDSCSKGLVATPLWGVSRSSAPQFPTAHSAAATGACGFSGPA